MSAAPLARPGQTVEDGPRRHRNELRWRVRLPDGNRAVLAQLLPELAADPALRRRFVYEAERLRNLGAPSLAPILAIGPGPDPRAPEAEAPWRLRVDPDGRSLDAWLEAAPLPIDEALDVCARVADAMHAVHVAGAVVRDIEPRSIVVGTDERVWLTDVGLARLDILSTRTASSLMLESSPYAAPEHLRATVVDPRADVFTLGVILWRALTGTMPYGDQPALRRDADALPALLDLRDGVPAPVAELAHRCLDDDPDARPESAREVAAVLRGEAAPRAELALARESCQACGEPLRPGLRLCLSCGREAVQFTHTEPGGDGRTIELCKATDEAGFIAELRRFFETTGDHVPRLDFLTGDARMYAKEEREHMHTIPACLYADLPADVAHTLAGRLRARGMKVRVRNQKSSRRRRRIGLALSIASGVSAVSAIPVLVAGAPVTGVAMLLCGFAGLIAGTVTRATAGRKLLPLARLRSAPAALPASDPYVARIAALLEDDTAPDLRARLGELALLLQRLCDRRAGADGDTELEMITEPLEPLTALVEREAGAVAAIDRELVDLDEGAIVRALAASEARREPASRREPLLSGLDRLRSLEDRRAAHMARLLEASSLLRRTVDLARDARDPDDLHDADVTMALAALRARD